MRFTEEELFYLKELLTSHALILLDIAMNSEDDRDSVRSIANVNKNCMDKLNEISN